MHTKTSSLGDNSFEEESIVDALNSGNDFGYLFASGEKLKKISECRVLDKLCSSIEEFRSLTKPLMGGQ